LLQEEESSEGLAYGISDTNSRGFERSSTTSKTHEMLILLHRLAASTSPGVVVM
jgi:hypothetical protein